MGEREDTHWIGTPRINPTAIGFQSGPGERTRSAPRGLRADRRSKPSIFAARALEMPYSASSSRHATIRLRAAAYALWLGSKMKRVLLAAAAVAVLSVGANARDDSLPANFVGDWCFGEHTADHLAFYRRGRCVNVDNVEDWLTINPDSFDLHEMHCQLLVARANKRGDYLAKFRCDDNLIQNYWFSLFNDRLFVSQTNTES
jgi:hypothetical protein